MLYTSKNLGHDATTAVIPLRSVIIIVILFTSSPASSLVFLIFLLLSIIVWPEFTDRFLFDLSMDAQHASK